MYESKLDKYDIMVAIGAQLKSLKEVHEALNFMSPMPSMLDVLHVLNMMRTSGDVFITEGHLFGLTCLRPADAAKCRTR